MSSAITSEKHNEKIFLKSSEVLILGPKMSNLHNFELKAPSNIRLFSRQVFQCYYSINGYYVVNRRQVETHDQQ